MIAIDPWRAETTASSPPPWARIGRCLAALLAAALLVPPAAWTLTIVPPLDLGDLALESDAVVLATAGASRAERRGPLVWTLTDLAVEEVLSGELRRGELVRLQTPGGAAAGRSWIVPGSPPLELGATYLLCLQRRSRDLWVLTVLGYGLLAEETGASGRRLLVPRDAAHATVPRPDGRTPELLVPCDEERLLEHLARVLSGRAAWDLRLAAAEDEDLPPAAGAGGAAPPAGCAYFSSGGSNFRWRAFDSGGRATMYAEASGDTSVPGGGFREVRRAMDLWMDISGTSYNLQYGGPREVRLDCASGEDAAVNVIIFNDPCSDIGDLQNCGGTLAFGGPIAQGTHAHDGETWWTITGWIVVVNNGTGCIGTTNYRRMIAHELGHGLGYAHVADSGSLMFATCCRDINTTDVTCSRFTYPAVDPANRRPQVDAGADRTVSLAGDTISLEATASDDGLPSPPGSLAVTWRPFGGPGTVRFSAPSSLETTASFSRSGTYLLGVTADDGELLRSDDVRVTARVWTGTTLEVSFQQSAAGYGGTVDTFLQEARPGADNSAARSLSVDADDPGGSGLASQVLLRFDGVFGDRPGQIPPGALVRSARLELMTANTGAGAALHLLAVPWAAESGWSTFGGDGIQAGTEALATPEATAPGSGEPVTIDVTASVAAWSLDPCTNQGWALLPLGDDGWDFDSAEGGVPPRLVVEYQVVQEELFVRDGDSWEYFAGRVEPPAEWREPAFTPGAGWRSGPAGLGYGDGDDRTVVSDMRGSYVTLYCRRTFQVADPGAVGRLVLAIDYDDGFVAYLNGAEVARSASMGPPGSPAGRNTPAASREAGSIEEYSLDRTHLVAGTNVLAVEVHNAAIDSSDLSFIPELQAAFLAVADGDPWRFHRGSSAPAAGWTDPDFDDSAWELGPTGLGYGDGDDRPVLADMQGRYGTLFCRRAFRLPGPGRYDQLLLTAIYDDGLVLHLNGQEIARENVPAGPVTHETLAAGPAESAVVTLPLPEELLGPGANILAASVHNASLASSDLSFTALVVPARAPRAAPPCGVSFRFQRGDASGDGALDISDAVRLLIFLFRSGAALACEDAGDMDDDGLLRLSDAVRFLNFLFRGGAPLPPPGSSCGEDPTADGLADCSTPSCAR